MYISIQEPQVILYVLHREWPFRKRPIARHHALPPIASGLNGMLIHSNTHLYVYLCLYACIFSLTSEHYKSKPGTSIKMRSDMKFNEYWEILNRVSNYLDILGMLREAICRRGVVIFFP